MAQSDLQPLESTDTFSTWAEKINAIQNFLVTTNFATDEEVVDKTNSQTISGTKTFNSTTIFNGFQNDSGTFQLNGLAGIINSNNLYITCPDGLDIISHNGLQLRSAGNVNKITLKYNSANEPSRLIFDYAGSEEGIFEITTGNRLDIKNGRLGVGNIIWNLPTTNPGTPSFLQWSNTTTNGGNNLTWKSYADFANELQDDVIDALANSSLNLTVNIIPLASTIDIDTDALINWGVGKISDDLFPGWLRCNGTTINRTEEGGAFNDLVTALTGNPSTTSATLPGVIDAPVTKLIKYKNDPVTTFALKTGNGIEFLNSNTNVVITDSSGLTLKGVGGKIGLNVNPDHFSFTTGTGRLNLNNLSSTNVANSIAQRTSTGALVASTPTENNHLTTKSYVDNSIQISSSSTLAFPEILDGSCYNDKENTFVIVDKFGNGKAYGDTNSVRGVENNEYARADLQLNTFSPITENITKFKKAFASPSQYFFVDEDDILYANGGNSYGVLGDTSRGRSTSGTQEAAFFLSWTDGGAYNVRSGMTVPAMLPTTFDWPAYAVSFEYATGINSAAVSNTAETHALTIKTKDGLGNSFVNGDGKQGFVRFFTTNTNLPYTRGYFISSSPNFNGQLANGTTSNSTTVSVWKPTRVSSYSGITGSPLAFAGAAGQILWDIYGRSKDSDRADANFYGANNISNFDKIRKRFHWFKPNAVKAGGLSTTDNSALAQWRTETGLSNTDNYNDYSWYIKKVLRTENAQYVIVGKPGDETTNECWAAGNNYSGNLSIAGNIASSTPITDFTRVCGDGPTVSASTYTKVTNTVFKLANNQPHNFRNLEIFQLNTVRYFIVRGDQNFQNLDTQFRLFALQSAAAAALIRRSNQGVYDTGAANPFVSPNTVRVFKALLGVFDIVAGGSFGYIEKVYARVAVTNNVDVNALDALPESAITSVQLYSWGSNLRGCLGRSGVTSTYAVLAGLVSFNGSGLNGAKIIKIATSNTYGVAFALDSLGNLWFAGDNTLGLADSGNLSLLDNNSINNQFRKTTISLTQRVLNFFFIDGSDPDFRHPRIFVITQNLSNSSQYYLYAGGRNRTNCLGTNDNYDNRFINFKRIPFTENPANIVSMCGIGAQTLALVKDPGSNIGRVYQTGYDNFRGVFSSADGNRMYPFFRNIDRFIS